MLRLAVLFFMFFSLSIFSQKKIYTIRDAQGVIFSSKNYSEKTVLVYAERFEYIFQKKYGTEYNDYVRQYSISNIDGNTIFFVILIPMEKSYEYQWRYKEYHGRSRLVRVVFYNIDTEVLSEVSWVNIDE